MSFIKSVKQLIIGDKKDPRDPNVYHKISLLAFFAWIGLGADPLSSSCYGPAEAFLTLGQYHYLGIFIALATAFTIIMISASYSQTIELFPSGGGGYLVASKLHSPFVGVVSGSALLIDYVLTISVSVTAGADAIFSFLPMEYSPYKIAFAILSIIILLFLNLRGVKESILFLAPIFIVFVVTHLFAILYALLTHLSDFSGVFNAASVNISQAQQNLGFYGMIFLILKAFSMGAGTFTGIEAVSNGLPVLREPKVRTAKHTMRYIAVSLSFTAAGLMLAFLLFKVGFEEGKTLNAVFFQRLSSNWGIAGSIFLYITLISEAALLFVAAQAGFIDGPRVLSNMALDKWMPARLSILSDRLVTKNGIVIMGISAIVITLIAYGKLEFLIVLYSINIFITFILTESGMIKHWWRVRKTEPKWRKKIIVNLNSFTIDVFILTAVIIMKFYQGGWITLLITGSLVIFSLYVKKHYDKTAEQLKKLDILLTDQYHLNEAKNEMESSHEILIAENPSSRTAVLLVNGYSGIGIHSLLSIFKLFGDSFKNFVFIEIGLIDSGVFKGIEELDSLKAKIEDDVKAYSKYVNTLGFYGEGFTSVGLDIVEEVIKLAPQINSKYPNSVYFGGQIVFPKDTFLTKLLHNYTVFSVQKKLYHIGKEFVILPIKL